MRAGPTLPTYDGFEMDVKAELRFGELSLAIVGAPMLVSRGGLARSDTLVVAMQRCALKISYRYCISCESFVAFD